jgi:alpha-mannosidase
VDTYTAQATVGDVNKGLTNHKVGFPYTLSVKISLIFSLTQNLESSIQLRRIRAVTNTHLELPPVSIGRSVDEFFEDVERPVKRGGSCPISGGSSFCGGSFELLI